jgi:Cu+-exporting ATPase
MLGRAKFYIKNSTVIERLGEIDTIIFDKTGTITHGARLKFQGKKLSPEEEQMIKHLASNSTHPLSKKISEGRSIKENILVSEYEEFPGKGIRGYVNGVYLIMGSEYFVTGSKTSSAGSSRVFIRINEELKGFYSIENIYRHGILDLVKKLRSGFNVMLLSGDNDAEKENLKTVFGEEALHFDQKPEDKSGFIRNLQQKGHKVLMIGDGLNDTGALLHSDVGIAVSDNTNNFSPSCDAILQGNSFVKLYSIISYAKSGKKIIYASFILSILYNIVGLYFAVQGTLSPVIAAILMPVSSISIVLLTTISSNWIAEKKLKMIDDRN